MNHTLVVIDMQVRFIDHDMYKDCIQGVVNQVQLAKYRNDHIVIVEYDASQTELVTSSTSKDWPTTSVVNNLLLEYKKACYVSKKNNDGGVEVLQAMRTRNIPHDILRVCGVYANWCVRSTVETLAAHLKKSQINLIDNAIACAAADINSKSEALLNLRKFKNVRVLK